MPGASLVRFVALAAVIVSVALALSLLDAGRGWVVAGVIGAWLVASRIEWITWSRLEGPWHFAGRPGRSPVGSAGSVPPPGHPGAAARMRPDAAIPVRPAAPSPLRAPPARRSSATPPASDEAPLVAFPPVPALASETGPPVRPRFPHAPPPVTAPDAEPLRNAVETGPERVAPPESPPIPAARPTVPPAPPAGSERAAGDERARSFSVLGFRMTFRMKRRDPAADVVAGPASPRELAEPEPDPEPAPARAEGPPPQSEPKPERTRDPAPAACDADAQTSAEPKVERAARPARDPAPPPAAAGPSPEPEREPELAPEAQPPPAEPEPEPEPVRGRPRVAAAPPFEPEVEPARAPVAEPAGEDASVVRLDELRAPEPREWNLWALERAAREDAGAAPADAEERAYLLLHLRQFAAPDGLLPTEFDGLVRESFGTLIRELERA